MTPPRVTFGSLFTGIGGLDLGLERAGLQCAWQVEINAYATKVLTKHWPHVARFRDVRSVGRHTTNLTTCYCPLTPVDVLAGGFPCQDISPAGKRAGIDGERSGLWADFFRLICELRPRYVLVENSADLLRRGMGRVLGDLAGAGYDAEWCVLSAAQLGAPHLRRRTFIVAYPNSQQYDTSTPPRINSSPGPETSPQRVYRSLAHPDSNGRETLQQEPELLQTSESGGVFQSSHRNRAFFRRPIARWELWADEPNVGRVAHGVPSRLDRLSGIGNAVVPQVAEYIGNCVLAAECER
jgi:DNA (cytosine-5)-methyltransferase 1